MSSLPRWIGLAGPTASGKTAAALAIGAALAGQRPVEIISVDSALVYRGMDIGTAKPTFAERAQVPHHLIDIRDPHERYSAAAFVADATRLIADITARGGLPLLVGGTMLYFKALIDGLDIMPAADPAVRARIETEAAALGWPALHARLAEVDAATAARLAPKDSQRIQRALEVWHTSGQPLSQFHRRPATEIMAACACPSGVTTIFSLEPLDRAWLHQRIAERFDAMLANGFIEEVKRLRARGDLSPELPSMRCVGYRQAWEMLDAQAQRGQDIDTGRTNVRHTGPAADTPRHAALRDLRERGIATTRQLAKRQLTWLRSMPARRVIAADAPDAVAQVVSQVLGALNIPEATRT